MLIVCRVAGRHGCQKKHEADGCVSNLHEGKAPVAVKGDAKSG